MSRKLEIEFEQKVVKKIIDAAIARGYSIIINNGDSVTKKMRNANNIFAKTFLTDEDSFEFYKENEYIGFIEIVYGNVVDVLSEYSINLEGMIKPINDFIEPYRD